MARPTYRPGDFILFTVEGGPLIGQVFRREGGFRALTGFDDPVRSFDGTKAQCKKWLEKQWADYQKAAAAKDPA